MVILFWEIKFLIIFYYFGIILEMSRVDWIRCFEHFNVSRNTLLFLQAGRCSHGTEKAVHKGRDGPGVNGKKPI